MTLTQVAFWTRRGVISFGVFIVVLTISIIGYNLWRAYYLAHLPPVEEKPELKFGTLPSLNFPSTNVSTSNYSYSLDTVTGGFPKLPKISKVYFIPKLGLTLLSSERAQKLAESLGFPQGPTILSDTEYRFSDGNLGTLNIDLSTGNFHFQRITATSSATLDDNAFTDQKRLVQDLKSYLGSKGLTSDTLNSGRDNIIFDSDLANTATSAEVSLWPADLDNLPIVTADFNKGLVKAVITKDRAETNKYLKLDNVFWTIDTTTSSTYPLKTPEQAFTDLKSGLGFVTMQSPNPKISITLVYLAYYESEEYSPFLQPVFVFEGPGFAAVVPAVSNTVFTPPTASTSAQPTRASGN
ncbi:MAG: hypothetical protein Q7S44_03805 [bacterium]|nr:hypothetical protein [bacterium]